MSWPLNFVSRDLFIILGHYVAHLEKPELNISKYHDHDSDTTSDCYFEEIIFLCNINRSTSTF